LFPPQAVVLLYELIDRQLYGQHCIQLTCGVWAAIRRVGHQRMGAFRDVQTVGGTRTRKGFTPPEGSVAQGADEKAGWVGTGLQGQQWLFAASVLFSAWAGASGD
jgi:hypothetical protein